MGLFVKKRPQRDFRNSGGLFEKKTDTEDLDIISKTSGVFSQKKRHGAPPTEESFALRSIWLTPNYLRTVARCPYASSEDKQSEHVSEVAEQGAGSFALWPTDRRYQKNATSV